jgi:putative component of membrane protein insertase Oxa1/YidC/SpoIIIJ protein YidD
MTPTEGGALPRALIAYILVAGVVAAPRPALAQGWLTVEELGARLERPARPTSCGRIAGGMWFKAYRSTFSRARPGACNFEPSCSHFSEEAIRDEGFLKGMVMTGERLERCNQCLNLAQYPRGRGGEGERILDPVTDDDVWWWFEGGHKGEQRWREGLLNAAR